MRKMSTGQDATLGNYLAMATLFFGEDSPAVEFLQKKIDESPEGMDEEIIADEGQMVNMLISLNLERGWTKGV